MKQNSVYLGESRYINDGIDMAAEFEMIAKQDEKAAILLSNHGLYNQSVYYYIQSMEKFIKSNICKKLDITNDYYANRLRDLGHSLDAALDFFIEIVSGNDNNFRIQINEQLKNNVLKGIHFSVIHNSSRYPSYKNGRYRITEMTRHDCIQLQNIFDMLKVYINSINIKI